MARKTKPNAEDQDSQPALQAIAADIQKTLARARHASESSLKDFRSIGEALIKAKPLLPRGGYLEWARETFHFSKQWCSALTKLAASWSDYESARSWAEAEGRLLGRREYSVDGALGLIRQWQRAMAPAPEAGEDNRKQRKPSIKEELAETRRKLDEALETIERLQAMVSPGPKHGPSARNGKSAPLDFETREKARKVAALWHRGSTGGECSGAEGRLRHFAQKCGYEFEDFLVACGIESPADWTFSRAA
ncbi:DUF3102 domain-containing protein [Microvirga massiliensis]|uniref:DUF3102 domain-containing protein n=1 Tax=Microvirga massiliensis TaxID=1033741 RepID=UPI00062BDE70|nr:DUF3102 domain-containing protein [Microvirga massiliensis]